ncbi:MAG: PilZ domain-containing protein [Desulfovibrionaceae bacterium]
MKPKILALAEDAAIYAPLALAHEVDILSVSDVEELIHVLTSQEHNGIILELRKMIRSNQHQKHVLQEWIDTFPVLRVNVDRSTGTLNALGDLNYFLDVACREFPARRVRVDKRVTVHMPVLLSRGNDPRMERFTKSHTMNLSEKGMFLYSTEPWFGEEWAWVRFLDLRDDTPVLTRLNWFRPWGAGLNLSGIGVVFAQITPEQHGTICSRFLLRRDCAMPDLETFRAELEAYLARLGMPPSSAS